MRGHIVSIAALAVTCAVWSLLSQIAVVRLPGYERFFGPDGVVSFLEEKTRSARFAWRGGIPAPAKVCYVDVDSLSIGKLGNFPWNRALHGMVIDALFKHGGVKAVGMDFVFSDDGSATSGTGQVDEGTKRFASAIRRHRNVVLAATYASQNRPLGDVSFFPFVFEAVYGTSPVGPPELPAYPLLGPNWGYAGLIDAIGDGVAFLPFFAKADHHTYLPMSLQLVLLYWDLDSTALEIGKNTITVRGKDGAVQARIPLVMNQLVEPNWFSPWMAEENTHASFVEVLAYAQAREKGTAEQQAEAEAFFGKFRDAIVLIGPVDPLLKDLSVVPLSGAQAVPRVSVHGNLLQTIVSGRFLHRTPAWVNLLLIFGLGFTAASFAIVPSRFGAQAKVLGVLAVLGYIAGAFYVFEAADLLVPVAAPLLSAVSCVFVGAVIQVSREQRQKNRIKGMFGTYLSPTLVEQMIESGSDPQLGGVDAEITAFFSDVQSFSSFSELLTPQQLVAVMNEYLTAMTDILMESGCYVDKYIGDAIVGIFNAPAPLEHHALKACVATQLLHKRLAQLREKWASEGDKWPPIVSRMQMRIGLNSGFATVGNMGSEKRFNYTMMGDTVNLAARCESGSKSYGAYTMVTGETMRAATAAGGDCIFRHLDKIIVKGRSEPAEMHEVVCLAADLDAETGRCLEIYAKGMDHYAAQDWDTAAACFGEAAALEPNRPEKNPESPTTPSSVMLERCRALKANPPPPDWDGVYKMTSK